MRLGGLRRWVRLVAAGLGLVFALALPAVAQRVANGLVLISADTITHDQATGVVTASGKVELATETQTLLADQVIWDPAKDRVRAVGNVALVQPDGEVVLADEVELTDQFRNGFVSGLRVLLADQSRFAATEATRADGTRTEMLNAIFTACATCAGDPNPPAWQVKAARIVHDKDARKVYYEHARLELFGVPTLYTPYFSHADPTVRRLSGILVPTYGTNNQLGATLEVPYYINIAPDRDATITPMFTTREGPVLKGEYRQATPKGSFETRGSITQPRARDGLELTDGRDTRGHVEANGQWKIDDVFRWGFTGARATDDTYLRRYEISNEDTLVTNAFVEGIDGRNYASVNAWAFQGLRADDDPGHTPLVLPMIDYVLYGPPGRLGQYASLDANALAIRRSDGADTMRISTGASWRLPYTSPRGDVYQLSARLRADAYAIDGQRSLGDPATLVVDGLEARLLPRVAIDWRYPLVRGGSRYDFLVEPIASVILAPYGGNPRLIPNEDSPSFQFDDTNLLSPTRFPGRDRWEGGPRINYGIKLGTYSATNSAYAMIGQTVRARDDTFPPGSGLEKNPSDYVGRINVQWGDVDLQQRFRMNRDSLSLRRNEVDLAVGPEAARLSAGYVYLTEDLETDEFGQREELSLGGQFQIRRGWSVTARSTHDLRDDGGLRLAGFGLVYECDCMKVSLEMVRRLTEDRDVPRSTSISLRLNLRHLG